MLEEQQQEQENNNINLSEGLRELIYKANTFAETAAQIIVQAYRYAIDVDKHHPQNAAKILQDNLVYSPQWIRKQLPEEAKHLQMRRLPPSIAKDVSQIIEKDKPKVENIIIPPRNEIIHDVETINVESKPAATATAGIKEEEENNNIAIMDKKECLKFANDLRVDILGRLNKDGTIQFQIIDGELIYKLL